MHCIDDDKFAHHWSTLYHMYVPKLTGVRSEDGDAGGRVASCHQISGQFNGHMRLGEIKIYIKKTLKYF